MSAGSDASNLGYGKIIPNSNVNPHFVNRNSSNYAGGFGSNEIPGLPGLAGAKNNVDAAASFVPGICLMKGGRSRLKKKIKNITKMYKMKNKKTLKHKFKKMGNKVKHIQTRSITRARSLARSLAVARSFAGGRRRKSKRNKSKRSKGFFGGSSGYPQSIPYPPGYGQYQNNLPSTPTYSVGGVIGSKDVGLANPPPISVLSNCTNCVDNYNHFTNKGFASRGH
jgi:hypothetical protein